MLDEETRNVSDTLDTVPVDPPPAYEPKPSDNIDVEEAARNDEPTTSPWKRLLLSFVLFILSFGLTILVIYAFTVRPQTVYSSVYSKEFRFRPAASPVITETLADGRTLIHGALPSLR